MRFKGLTLRSKGIRASVEASRRTDRQRVVVGNIRGSSLNSRDIALALGTPLSPLFPFVKDAEYGSVRFWIWIAQQPIGDDIPLSSTKEDGAGKDDDDGIAREKKGEKEAMPIEKDLFVQLSLVVPESGHTITTPIESIASRTSFGCSSSPLWRKSSSLTKWKAGLCQRQRRRASRPSLF